MRSAICATTARSCETYTAVVPRSRTTGLKARSTSICVVTSSAVVGSSRITSVRVGDQRHRRHQPLQLAAGDLVRIALADGLRFRQRQLAEQRDRLGSASPRRQRAVDAADSIT
jgi:hypothetical protein